MAAQETLSADVVVIGGGVIGLSVAWYLRHEGASVIVLERGQVGGQASGAAAGMLAPLAEAKSTGPFVELGLASLQLYPAFVEALRDETGLDPELVGPGMLRIALSETDVEWLTGPEAHTLEPALTDSVRSAILSSREQHVEPRRLVRALALANGRRGVRIIEGAPVTGFLTDNAHVMGVQTPDNCFSCGHVVVAGGAWTEAIGSWLHAALPVFPIRGQILALACLPPPMTHTLYTHEGYLVPKTDGRVVVGATEDRAGFDARPTVRGVAFLLDAAARLMPSLAQAAFDSAWAGLRPASADGLPILGPLPGWENVHVAAGHFRNGILLAPITGEIVAQSVLNRAPHPLLAPFHADRFAPEES
jgi:glycine oxidase